MEKAAFLDRDGVLNLSIVVNGVPRPPMCIDEVEILDGVVEAIALLKESGYLPVVITNQPDVARGLITQTDLNSINKHIGEITGINHFYSCLHDDSDGCICRKPKPGLIVKASADLKLDLTRSFLVGDRWRDIDAGQATGCQSFFIDYSYAEKRPTEPYVTVSSLMEAVTMRIGGNYGA